MDFLPSELNISKTRELRFVRKTMRNIADCEKLYYFFTIDISSPNGIMNRFTFARIDCIDDATLQQYGFNTERSQAKDNSLANWINTIYYNKFMDGEICTVIQYEIEDVNGDGSPEYKTFISRQ